MTTLTVTSRGQVTFRKEVLQHLGIEPGDTIQLDLLPDGRAQLKATRPKGSFKQVHGLLKGKTNDARLSIKELNEAIEKSRCGGNLDLCQAGRDQSSVVL